MDAFKCLVKNSKQYTEVSNRTCILFIISQLKLVNLTTNAFQKGK